MPSRQKQRSLNLRKIHVYQLTLDFVFCFKGLLDPLNPMESVHQEPLALVQIPLKG